MFEFIDKILVAQSLVRQAEAGEIGWDVVFDAAFDQGHLDPNEILNFVAGAYERFRLTEAAAYRFRQGNDGYPNTGVRNLIATCDLLKADIHEVLRNSETFEATTPGEAIEKMWVEEKLRWALSIFDSFKAWGYHN